MPIALRKPLFALAAFSAAALFGTAVLTAAPEFAFAKGHKGDHSPNAEFNKKPGQSCDQFKKDSDEYKDCVKAQAQSDKHDKGKGHDHH